MPRARGWLFFPFAVVAFVLVLTAGAYACTTMGGQTYIDTIFGPNEPTSGGSFTAHADGLTQVTGGAHEYYLMQDPNGNYCHPGASIISPGLGRGATDPWNTGPITGQLDVSLGPGTYFVCVSNYSNSAWPQEIQVYGRPLDTDGPSASPSISAEGRYVAYSSTATNLVADDTNGADDVFVYDRAMAATTRVSLGTSGGQSNGPSSSPSISADGRYLAFSSTASNLVTGDTNGVTDIFVHDRVALTTNRVSNGASSTQANGTSSSPSISPDGRYVAFASSATNLVSADTNGSTDVFVHDRSTSTTSRSSVGPSGAQANGSSSSPAISGDGLSVAFTSSGSNLVSGDTNGKSDVFVRDRTASTTSRTSVGPSGAQANGSSSSPSISGDRRYVAFSSDASNLVSGDTNNVRDVFEYGVLNGVTARLSFDDVRGQANSISSVASISTDGTYTAFQTAASNFDDDLNVLDDIHLHAWEPASEGGTAPTSETTLSSKDLTATTGSGGGACTGQDSPSPNASLNQLEPSSTISHDVCVVTQISKSLLRTQQEDSECGQSLYYYSGYLNAFNTYLFSLQPTSPRYEGSGQTFPTGAYTSTISPDDPGWTQPSLSAHFYGGNTARAVGWFVRYCSLKNAFIPIPGPPGNPYEDFWYQPGEMDSFVPVDPEYFGPNPMPE